MANNPVSAASGKADQAAVTADNSANGAAVWATARPSGRAVVGLSDDGVGVWGQVKKGRAIVGAVDTDGTGIWGEVQTGRAIVGACDQTGTGVWGESKNGGVGVVGVCPDGDGIRGSGHRGVVGESTDFQGVFGHSVKNAGVVGVGDEFHGIWAESKGANSAGLYARNVAGGNAAWLDGPVAVSGSLTVQGDVFLPGADYAEHLPAGERVIAGDCVVIDDDARVVPCARDYDTRVAGIVSGAGGLKPALVLDRQESGAPIALMGKAFVRVDADRGPVRVGDLLTTSSTPGHAMGRRRPRAGGQRGHRQGTLAVAVRPWPGEGLRQRTVSAMLSLRAFLVDTSTPMPAGLRGVLGAKGVHTLRELLRTDLPAASVSWVGGGPPVTLLDDPGVQEKITVVVFSDGYALGSQHTFDDDTDRLFVTGLFGIDFWRDNRHNFRVVRVGLVSADDVVSGPNIPRDTAFGLVYDGTFEHAGFPDYTADNYARLAKALRVWRLDGDVVAVIAQTLDAANSWGRWGGRLMAVTPNVFPGVIAHELGHTFGMADEYVGSGQDQTYGDGEPDAPNVTKETDPSRLKWKDLLTPGVPIPTTSTPPGWVSDRDVGLFEGALRVFAHNVYRPSDDCKMNHDSLPNPDGTRRVIPFCRVCARAVAISVRYAIEHQGTPQGAGTPGASGGVAVTVRRDPDGSYEVLGALPATSGSLLGPPRPDAEVHVARLDGNTLAASPVRTAPAHGFRSGPDGRVEHVGVDPSSEVFEVHLPHAVDTGALTFERGRLPRDTGAATWTEAARALG